MDDNTAEALKFAFIPYYAIYKALTKASEDSSESAASDDLEALRMLEARQEVEMRMAERQAKVAQELAIADRIRTAVEVEIEEFYDVSGEAALGGGTDGATVSVKLGAKGSKVTRRVYRFQGVRGDGLVPTR